MGSPPHSRRTRQTWGRRLGTNRIAAAGTPATFPALVPILGNVSEEPRVRHGVNGLLHGLDVDWPRAVRAGPAVARRRRILHVNCTEHPTASWTAQQVVDAFPEDAAPRFLLRDRDCIYDATFRRRVAGLGLTEVVTSA